MLGGQSEGCAVSMTLSFQNTTEVVVGAFLPVMWTVTVDPALLGNANALNETALFTTTDQNTRTKVQVIHSNIHSCQFGSNCDPFRLGTNFVDNTPNQVGNFTSNHIVFTSTDDLVYNDPGLYSVLAHIILPGATDNERFDFAVYQRLTVVAAASKTSSSSAAMSPGSSGSSSLSSTSTVVLIVGILAIVLVAVGMVLWIRHKRRPPPSNSSCDMSSGQSTFTSMDGNTPKNKLVDEIESDDDSVFGQIAVLGTPKLHAPRRSIPQIGSEAQQRINRLPLIYRDMSSVSEDSESFAFHPRASHGTSQSEQKIVSTNNSVDFIYPDSDMSLDIVDTGYTEAIRNKKKTYVSSDSMDSVGSSDSYAGFVVQGDWAASNRVFDDRDSDVNERHRELLDTELYGHGDVEI